MVKYTNMSFDLTKLVPLDEKNYRLYRRLRLVLPISAFLFAVYFSYLILFPRQYFTFSFLNPDSNRNTLDKPKSSEQELVFYTPLVGDYSRVKVNFATSDNSNKLDQAEMSIRKSYEAFLYDQGDPIGFKDGSLLKNNGNHYIVSEGKLRKFSDFKIMSTLGYSDNNFRDAADNEITANPTGNIIGENDSYPDDSLFKIEDTYYILEGQQLKKFTSEIAFLSQYDSGQAIEKDESFLKNYSLSSDPIGFADGALVSNGDSAYIISFGKIYPIDNVTTFENKGYRWENVIPAGTDEISIYERTGLFNIRDAHPDGTIFETSEDSRYFLIKDGKKHRLPSANIAQTWLKKSPIIVSKNSQETVEVCDVQKKWFGSRFYYCEVSLAVFQPLAGSGYEFRLKSERDIQLKSINADYKKDISKANMKTSLLNIFNKFKNHYGLQISNQ